MDVSPKEELESFFGEGYKYSEDITFDKATVSPDLMPIDMYYTTQKVVSVVKADSNASAAQTTEAISETGTSKVAKAPKADDNCIIRFIGYLMSL